MEIPEESKQQVLEGLGELDEKDRSFVTDYTLVRFLRARKGDVKKATQMLKHTLEWRKERNIGTFKQEDFEVYLKRGILYIGGVSEDKKPVLVMRKRKDQIKASEEEAYLNFVIFTLEKAQSMIPNGIGDWVQLLDMNGYSRANAPPLKISLHVIQTLGNHYPEWMNKVYIIDAPLIFWVLYTAVYPFVDPVTRAKVAFVYTKDYDETGARLDGKADPTGFSNFYKFWANSYNHSEYIKLLDSL